MAGVVERGPAGSARAAPADALDDGSDLQLAIAAPPATSVTTATAATTVTTRRRERWPAPSGAPVGAGAAVPPLSVVGVSSMGAA